VRLWDTRTGRQQAAFFECRQALFSPDGKTLATMHDNSIMKFWDVPLRKPLGTVLACTSISWLAAVLVWRLIRRIGSNSPSPPSLSV
jgi:hypothetical protein